MSTPTTETSTAPIIAQPAAAPAAQPPTPIQYTPIKFDAAGNVIPNSAQAILPPAGPTLPKQQTSPLISAAFPGSAPITSASIAPTTPLALPDAGTSSTTQSSTSSYPNYSIPNALASNPVPTPPGHPGTNPDTGLPNPAPAPTPSAYDQILSKVGGLTDALGTEGDVTSQLQDQYDLPGKTADSVTAYNNYQQAKVALQQQIESMQENNPTGQLDPARQAEIANATRVGNANLANLAIIAQAASGNLTAAQNIIQAKLDAQFKPIEDQIQYLGQFGQMNQANLSQSEQAQIENQRYVLQNQLDTLMSAKQAAHTFALQQGITNPAVLNAIDTASTPADAYAAVGGGASGLPSLSAGASSSSSSGSGSLPANSQYGSYVTSTVDGDQYVSQDKLSNLSQYQQQDAARQYAAAGIPVLTSDQTQKIQSIDVTKQNLGSMSSILFGTPNSDGSFTGGLLGSGPVGRVGSAVSNWISGVTQSNPNVASFGAYRTLAINALQALGAGSGGARITQSEIATAVDNLPTLSDSAETATTKLGVLNGFLSKWTGEILPNAGSSSSSSSGDSNPFSPSNFNTPING